MPFSAGILVRELHGQGVTIVMITHDREIAAAARRRIELHDGRIAADRTASGDGL
jgi:ABC-type lipoprotein export system ATPase subunit